ncbi:MAG: mechanosensitive ion channel domain-containing protein [Pseudomonadota bacterium]
MLRRVVTHVFALTLIVVFTISVHDAVAADTPPGDKPTLTEKTSAPVAIPLAELSAQADAATINLREIVTRATVDRSLVEIERALPALTQELELRLRENTRILAQRPSLELLRSLERNWRRTRETLLSWNSQLAERLSSLEQDVAQLENLDGVWTETLALATRESAPRELITRAQTVLAGIERSRRTVDNQRALALRLQSRVGAQDFRLTEAVAAIEQARDVTLARVFQRDSPPLWSAELMSGAGTRIPQDSESSREAQTVTLQGYLQRNWDRLALHAVVFAALAALLYWVRRKIHKWREDALALQRPAMVFARPATTALLLSFIASRWIYPEAPRLMWALIGAAALIPTVIVVRRLIAPFLRPVLYVIIALFFLDQLRAITASIELLPRLLFFFAMFGGALFLLWAIGRIERTPGEPTQRRHTQSLTTIGLRVAFALFAITACANLIGYTAFANLLGTALLRSLYFGLVLYALVEIIDALVIIAMRVQPLKSLRMVQRHHELLWRRTRRVINVIAVIVWLLFVLERLGVRRRVIDGAQSVFTAQASIGSISISLADVLAFGVAVWAAFLVSRLVRFVLDEEVYPHANLKRGLPYAISQTLHYVILVIGFFIAMAALGLDMTKFTILAGAFTVGVGFGLQNIFNNFVSGLILLFERPVQAGDVIQLDANTAGVVQRIGIRASIIRTRNGSDIIVPNGKLISEQLVNWTFSHRQRGIEVPVAVVLGADPKQVIQTLERVGGEHPNLLKTPAPKALLTRVGPDWMGFELTAATDRIEDWMDVKSELAVEIATALTREDIKLR